MATKSKTQGLLPIIECTKCRTAYVVRLCFVLPSGLQKYRFQPDCRCKGGGASVREDEDGTALMVEGPHS